MKDLRDKNKHSKRVKLIVFGVQKYAYDVAQEAINLDHCEIIAFSDNDLSKCGLIYESIKIVSPSELLEMEFDYVLISAWYSYGVIRQQLIEIGINAKQIMPLLDLNCLRWLIGEMEDFDNNVIDNIFVDGEQLIGQLKQVNRINGLYERQETFSDTDKIKFTNYKKYPLIAHACGGYVNGKKMEYTNSLESLSDAISSGFMMFECDVWGVQDGLIILGSRLKMQYPIDISYTIFSLNALLEMISPDIKNKVILDIKWNTLEDFYRILDNIDNLVNEFEEKGFKEIRKQLLIETFDEKSTSYTTERNWECILTDYRNREGQWIKKTAVICCKYNVKAVLLDANFALLCPKYVQFLIDKNIDVLCYTVDEIDDYTRLKKIGVTSVLTNYLKPSI